MRTSYAIELVEVGYHIDGTPAEWFGRVLARLDPVLGHGLGLIGLVYRIDHNDCIDHSERMEGERLVVEHAVAHACPPGLLEFACATYNNAPPDVARMLGASEGGFNSFSEFARALAPEVGDAYREALRGRGLSDTLVLGAPIGVDSRLVFAAFVGGPVRTFTGQRRVWQRIGAHLANGWRLLQKLPDAPAAIANGIGDPRELSPRERTVVELAWTGASNKHIAYTLGLDAATIAHHLARGLRKLGLASRVELLRMNRRGHAGAELPLSRTELAIAELAARGLSNLQIARQRGRSVHTIANQIARIFEKLGIGSRAQLVVMLGGRSGEAD